VCSVIGHLGENYGIICFPGQRSYERFISISERSASTFDLDLSEVPEHFSFQFAPREELDSLDRNLAKEFDWPENAGLVPSFRSYIPGYPPAYLDFDEACFAYLLFKIGVDFVNNEVLSDCPLGSEIPMHRLSRPSRMFPNITKRRERWKAKRKAAHLPDSGLFEPSSVFEFKAIQSFKTTKGMSWEVALRSLPSVVVGEENLFVPRGWFFVDRDSSFVLDVSFIEPHVQPVLAFTQSLVKSVQQFGTKPQYLRIKKGEKFGNELIEICEQVGIRVKRVSSTPVLNNAFRSMSSYLKSEKDQVKYH